MHRLVGHFHMHRIAVGIGENGDRLDAHPPGGLDDPACNLAPIGNQDLGKHTLPAPFPDDFCGFVGFARTACNWSKERAIQFEENERHPVPGQVHSKFH
jgi:hypothetical protein